MKKLFIPLFVMAAVLITAAEKLAAQDIMGGTVKYQQTTKLDFSGLMRGNRDFQMRSSPRMKDMIASMPKERKDTKVLYFAEDKSLFVGDQSAAEVQSVEMGGRRMMFRFGGPSTTEVQEVYYDFGNNRKTEQIGFMTRDFLVSGEITKIAWKLTSKVTKILDYTCMAAQLERDDKAITALFTSEIPISAGPADYFGLPGLILAVEIDGKTAFLATSIDLTPPEKGILVKPKKGKKVTQKELEEIMAEKLKEVEETRDGKGPRRVIVRHN